MFYQTDRIHYDKNEYVQSDLLNEKHINYNLFNNNYFKNSQKDNILFCLNKEKENEVQLISINHHDSKNILIDRPIPDGKKYLCAIVDYNFLNIPTNKLSISNLIELIVNNSILYKLKKELSVRTKRLNINEILHDNRVTLHWFVATYDSNLVEAIKKGF